jgi:capsular exopolysaccharide synthesis family protein
MTHFDTAFRRGSTDRMLTVTEAAAPERALDVLVTGPAPDLLSRLPSAVVSQLANLSQTLQAHPSRPRSIAFVSSGRGEGTSTCLASIAAYLASAGSRVLIVDANPHHPRLHTIAGVAQEIGMCDLMAGRTDVVAAIKPTAFANLFVVTSGEREPAAPAACIPAALLRERVLDRTANYDFVLVDCPAVNVFEDAVMTAGACDATVRVVEGGRTPRHAAQASKSLLARGRCTILGVFMNKRKFYIPQFLYERL